MNANIHYSERLFSYGTLQHTHVQLTNFGRPLTENVDALPSYRLENLNITNAKVLQQSSQSVHSIAMYSGCDDDLIEGIGFEVSTPEIIHADAYEVSDYHRVKVTLSSGMIAWVYVAGQNDES